jgi:hypothetical protein
MKKNLMIVGAAALVMLVTASCSRETNYYDETAVVRELSVSYQKSFEEKVGTPNASQTWGFQSQLNSRRTRSILVDDDPFTEYTNTDDFYKSEAPSTAMTYSEYMNQDKWRRADWGGALDQNAAMNGDAEILLPDGEHTIKFTGGSHDFYVTGNATLNVPDYINQARIYVLPGKTFTLNMSNYINALEIYISAGATVNYNYDKLYNQLGDARIFNRGTLKLGRDNFEINQSATVYNEGTVTGKSITSKPGDGNSSFLYNYGDIKLSGMFQLNSCANFYNEGTMSITGETELTQGTGQIWWINKGTYTTGSFRTAAWNGTMYNFCSFFVINDAVMMNGQFYQMNGSYMEADRGVFDNFQFIMANNSGVNIKNGTKWGRDGADFRGKYDSPYQGFIAADDNAKVWVRLGGISYIPSHKGGAFHVVGANLTLGVQVMEFYNDMYLGTDWNGTSYWTPITAQELIDAKSENITIDKHNVTKIYSDVDFDLVTASPKYGSCGATWTPNNGRDIKEQGRIMCEDLGTIGDFDFNDVVFDAVIYTDGTTEITLLAAGGTLDLTVAGVEVHGEQGFNVGKTDNIWNMVNTGEPGEKPYTNHPIEKKDPVTFTAAKKYNSLIDIPIVVRKQEGRNITEYNLTAVVGQAPQKICVPIGTSWDDEYISITKAYPSFVDWVEGEDPFDWSWIQSKVDRFVDLDLRNNK